MTDQVFYDGIVHYCYLLQSVSNRRKWYVGYSLNPIHRLGQHNGVIEGGAKETSKDRPWKLICCLSGLPNHQQALMWEWAWQKRQLVKRPNGDKTPRYIHRLIQLLSLYQVTNNAYPTNCLKLSVHIDPSYWSLFQGSSVVLNQPIW